MAVLRPGDVFAGDFRVVRLLAEGGMGSVYVVEQIATGKQRALKLLRSDLHHDTRTRERFEQEARVASRIASEHVVEVVSAGIDPSTDMPWLCMELLEGRDLAGYLVENGRPRLEDARQILGQVGHALAAAHRVGVVHRDLKPENVFIAATHQRDRTLVVKVLDFGIAKLLAEARVANNDTAAVGTPRWMAPEQAEARGQVSPATDVWAYGLLAFLLITGELFWISGRDGGVMGMMREVLFDPVPTASVRAAALRVADALPAGFDAWFARCVDRDPAGRFPDAAAASAALEAVLARTSMPPGTPAPGPMTPTPYPQHLPAPPNVPSWTGSPAQSGHAAITGPAQAGARGGWNVTLLLGFALAGLGLLAIGFLVALGLLAQNRSAKTEKNDKTETREPRDSGADLSGTWTATGTYANGSGTYAGSASLVRLATGYRMNWALNRGGNYEGIAIVDGHTLGVSWSVQGGYSLGIYHQEGGRLHGRLYGSDGHLTGSEELEAAGGGIYNIVHASGGYTGRVTVVSHGENFALAWATSKGPLAGLGMKTREGFVVASAPPGHPIAVVVYDIVSPRRLSGRYAIPNDARTGTELLVRR